MKGLLVQSHLAGQHDHRHLRRSRRRGPARRPPCRAGTGRRISLTGDHQIDDCQVTGPSRWCSGDDRRPRLASHPTAALSSAAPIPPAAPAPILRLYRSARRAASSSPATVRGATSSAATVIRIGTPSAAPNTRAAPQGATAAGAHVTGRYQVDPRTPSPRGVQAAELFDQPAARRRYSRCHPIRRRCGPCPRPPRRRSPANSPAVRRERSRRRRRAAEQGQSTRLRAFQVCGRRRLIQHPLGPHVLCQADRNNLQNPPLPYPGGPVRRRIPGRRRYCGGDDQVIAGAHPVQARRDWRRPPRPRVRGCRRSCRAR